MGRTSMQFFSKALEVWTLVWIFKGAGKARFRGRLVLYVMAYERFCGVMKYDLNDNSLTRVDQQLLKS